MCAVVHAEAPRAAEHPERTRKAAHGGRVHSAAGADIHRMQESEVQSRPYKYSKPVVALAASTSGRFVAVCTADPTGRSPHRPCSGAAVEEQHFAVPEPEGTGEPVLVLSGMLALEAGGSMHSAAHEHDLFAAGDMGSLRHWHMCDDWSACAAEHHLPPARYRGVAFPDISCLAMVDVNQGLLAGCSSIGSVAVWDVNKGQLLMAHQHLDFCLAGLAARCSVGDRFPMQDVTCLKTCGRLGIVGTASGAVCFWDVVKAKPVGIESRAGGHSAYNDCQSSKRQASQTCSADTHPAARVIREIETPTAPGISTATDAGMADSAGQAGSRGGRRRPVRASAAKSPTTPGSAGASAGGAAASGGNCRYDSSLGLLTKKFVQLVEAAPDGVLDLNKAADSLVVQKRRIYDITNVLEGIGLIEKKSKNNIQWRGTGSADPEELQGEYKALRDEVAQLQRDELALDQCIQNLKTSIDVMTEDPANKSRLYVTEQDIAKVANTADDILLAVKAPQGTTLEVPDPDQDNGERRYRIILKSYSSPIDVWLVSSNHNSAPDQPQAQAQAQAQQAQQPPQPQPSASVLKQEEPAGFSHGSGAAGPSMHGMNGLHPMNGFGPPPGPDMPMSPGTSMLKIQNDADPHFWFDQGGPPPMGIADIFENDPSAM
ncbi:hypothetical protein WJX72_001605 [[Myrmecia] bisecta]|uniref:E2F/DP family winged-helix DNA-binding domain-containing protein n=1 Tax=[Myrmecia] bisecta TaxID=41462 RepID=A0AAW1PKR8_9CHLO